LGEEVNKEKGVNLKPLWKGYGEYEKDRLQNRWTEDYKYENIREIILDTKEIPEDALKIKGSDGEKRYDLRGMSVMTGNPKYRIFQDADLSRAILQGADLRATDLQRAILDEADLQGADLFGAKFGSTFLWLANLGEAKNIRYIEWENDYYIGEESEETFGGNEKIKAQKEGDLKNAEITYRDLKSFYKERRMHNIASEFHYRENVVKTELSYQPIKFLRTVFLDWTYGYGSRPLRLIPFCIGVILFFGFIYLVQTTLPGSSGISEGEEDEKSEGEKKTYKMREVDNNEEEPQLLPADSAMTFINCIYFSALSFATFGYGALRPRQWLAFFRLTPVEYKPVGWARIFVGCEAAIGIYLLALTALVLFKG